MLSFHRLVKCCCERVHPYSLRYSSWDSYALKGYGAWITSFIPLTIFRSSHAACGILDPRPEIKPAPPAVGAGSLSHWTSREVQAQSCFQMKTGYWGGEVRAEARTQALHSSAQICCWPALQRTLCDSQKGVPVEGPRRGRGLPWVDAPRGGAPGNRAQAGFQPPLAPSRDSLVAQTVKRLPAMRETRVWSLSWEDPLEKETATHSSTLA